MTKQRTPKSDTDPALAPFPLRYEADVDVDTLHEFPGNPKDHDVGVIMESMQRNGVADAIRAQQSTRRILGGHGTKKALVLLGYRQVPVLWVDCDDAAARRLVLVLNRAPETGGYNASLLADFLTEQATLGDLAGTGYDADDVDLARAALLPSPVLVHGVDPDAVIDPPADPVTRKGDRIVLGRHVLVCGDARDAATWDLLLGSRRAGMLWTDPPYGVDHAGGSKDPRSTTYRSGDTIKNDQLVGDALQQLLRTVLTHAAERSRPGASWYVCSPPGENFYEFATVLRALKTWRHTLTWTKDSFVFGRSDYHYRHEAILYGWVPGHAHTWNGGRQQDSVQVYDRPKVSKLHPTQKPVAMVQRHVENSSRVIDLVVDPFAGSGTTLVAAEASGRASALIEEDPAFCDVIVTRYETVTGNAAERPRRPETP